MTKRLLSLAPVRHAVNRAQHPALTETAVLAALAPEGGRAGGATTRRTRRSGSCWRPPTRSPSTGFHATTTRDIASRAGLSPAGVYVHFASKEVLLFELSRRGHARARDLLVEASRDAASPTGRCAPSSPASRSWHAEHYQLGRIVQYEFRHLTPEHRAEVLALRKEIDNVVADVLRDGVAAGELDVDDVPVTALALLSMADRRRPLVRPRGAPDPRGDRADLRRPRRPARPRLRRPLSPPGAPR